MVCFTPRETPDDIAIRQFCRRLPLFPYLTRKHSIRMRTTNLSTVGVGGWGWVPVPWGAGPGGCTVRSKLNKFEQSRGSLYGEIQCIMDNGHTGTLPPGNIHTDRHTRLTTLPYNNFVGER